jgi:predicted nucleic acid-binding protein
MTGWLIDKSAFARLGVVPDAEAWIQHIDRGLVRICTVTRLELGYSARSGAALREEVGNAPVSQMPLELLTPAMEYRALEVQQLLADRGLHRGPSIPDLLVAAVAEKADLIVLHVDEDFEIIAGLTGQPVQRLIKTQ